MIPTETPTQVQIIEQSSNTPSRADRAKHLLNRFLNPSSVDKDRKHLSREDEISQYYDNEKKLETFLLKNFQNGRRLLSAFRTNRPFFEWVMDKKLTNLWLDDLEVAHSFSPQGAEYAVARGLNMHEVRAVAYNFGVLPELAQICVAHQLPQLLQLWEEPTVEAYRAAISLNMESAVALLKMGYDSTGIKQAQNKLLSLTNHSSLANYALKHGLDNEQFDPFMDLVAQHDQLVTKLVELGTPLQNILEAIKFEQDKPRYSQYSLISHTHREEHYLGMLNRAKVNGAESSFRLRSKEENRHIGNGVNAYSPDGSPGGRGQENDPGLPFISTQLNSIQGYGSLSWVGHSDLLLRQPFLRFWSLGRVRSFDGGELSVSTRKGRLISLKNAIDHFNEQTEESPFETRENQARRLIKDFNGIKFPESEEAFSDEVDSYQLEDLSQILEEVKQMLDNEPDQGIDLHGLFVICLIPSDKIEMMKEKIKGSGLSDPEQALLISQLIPYEGSLYDAFDTFREDKTFYLDAVMKNCRAVGMQVTDEELENLLDTRQAMSNTSIIESEPKYFGLSEIPLMTLSFEEFTPEISLALQDRLSRNNEWRFLSLIPQEAQGIFDPILEKIVRSVLRQMDSEGITGDLRSGLIHRKIQGYLAEIGSDIVTPFSAMSADRQVLLNHFFGLTDAIDTSHSVLDNWMNVTFPAYRWTDVSSNK